MKNGNVKRKIFNNFNEDNYILNDPKQEDVFIGFIVNNGEVVFDSFKKNNCIESNVKGCIGKLGKGEHLRIFRLNEFRKELAPINAVIEESKVNGEKIIRMIY